MLSRADDLARADPLVLTEQQALRRQLRRLPRPLLYFVIIMELAVFDMTISACSRVPTAGG